MASCSVALQGFLVMAHLNFDEYIKQGEPDRQKRAENWQIAIGLQAVDGLKPSQYLIETAKRNIEGEISIDEVSNLIDAYYQSKEGRTESEKQEGVEEADKVSKAIAKLLGEQSFTFSVATYANIHRRIFAGVLKHAGEYRTYNITKKEWVLDGDTVTYAPWELLRETLNYDFEVEKTFSYQPLDKVATIKHIAHFSSGIWQIHAFAEGNTRTTAIFMILYLRSLGYTIGNDPFAANSWYFRNALVRANYTNHAKGIVSTPEYLERFFRNILYGANYELKNRYLHISASKEIDPNWQIDFNVQADGTLSGTLSGTLNESQKKVLIIISKCQGINGSGIIEKLQMPRDTFNKVIKVLVSAPLQYVARHGSKKTGGYVLTEKGRAFLNP